MKQGGLALLAGLVFLMAISLLAVTAANSMNLQQHLTANQQDEALALENARLAEATARDWLFSRRDFEREAGCASNCLLPAAVRQAGTLPDQPQFESADWWQLQGITTQVHPESGEQLTSQSGGTVPAIWIMEEVHYESQLRAESRPEITGLAYYRILSRGTGRNARSVAVTELLLARPWGGQYETNAFPPSTDSVNFCRQFSVGTPCGTLAWRRLK